jgi:spore coat polysaccharide biosynthesis protein SpsF
MKRRLVAAIACRNQGSRLYGKPIQNLDVTKGIRIIDNIINCLKTINCIGEIVLGISEGIENDVFIRIAEEKGLRYVVGDQKDVLSRLISCGKLTEATDIFRITSESPFLYFEPVEKLWSQHVCGNHDATFLEEIIDGSGFEIISLDALITSHKNGESRHRSELCTLYIRENSSNFKIRKVRAPKELIRKDLRLTVDNPEDLVVCRTLYSEFKDQAPRISISELVHYLDKNSKLKDLIAPYSELGYSTMYV